MMALKWVLHYWKGQTRKTGVVQGKIPRFPMLWIGQDQATIERGAFIYRAMDPYAVGRPEVPEYATRFRSECVHFRDIIQPHGTDLWMARQPILRDLA